MPKRNDRVAPPPPPGGWELRYQTKGAVDGWEELVRLVPKSVYRAFEALTLRPDDRSYSHRQHPLRGELGTRMIGSKTLAQWQYEVTGGGRIWYCIDPDERIVWLTSASTGHPRETD